MQYLKDEVRNNITQTALIEFKSKGFKGASIRSISKNSGTSVGNIYKYFHSKDELYEAVVGPVYHQAMGCIDQFSQVEINEKAETIFYKLMENIMEIIENNNIELSILLNKSEGSRYENCKAAFINVITEIVTGTMNYKLSKSNLALNDNFIIYLLSRNMVDSIAVILNSKDNHKEIRSTILSMIDILYGNIEHKLPGINLTED